MAALRILAVAIGTSPDVTLTRSADADTDAVRPYIRGLIDRLANRNSKPPKNKGRANYVIGINDDYVIDYRERQTDAALDALFAAEGPGASVIFCMSTTVVRRADNWAKTTGGQNNKPIVAVVSDPSRETFGNNVCGVSAMRSQHAGECMEEFRDGLPTLTKVYVLHKDGYDPSKVAKFWVEGDDNNELLTIASGDDTAARIRGQGTAPAGEEYGVLVLPADRFFSEREAIFAAARDRNFKTFWSVTDFVAPNKAYGGYGVPQKTAGRYMAWQVDKIWDRNGNIPKNPRWLTVKKGDVATARDYQPVPFIKGKQTKQSKSKPSRTKKLKPRRTKKR